MPLHAVLAFWAVITILISVPGPDWAFTLGVVLGGGSVVAGIAGLAVGYLGITMVVAGGLGAIVTSVPAILGILTFIGGGYLIWLGVSSWMKSSTIRFSAESSLSGKRRTFLRGVGVSGLNPKGLLVFLALLPQFTSKSNTWPVVGQLVLLGLVFITTCVAIYSCLGAFASKVLSAKPRVAFAVTRFASIAMVSIGILLLFERFIK